MAEGFADLATLQQEGAGHALNVAGWISDEVAVEPSVKHARDAPKVQVLAKLGTLQAELLVQPPLRIAEPRNVEKAIRFEEPLSLFFGSEMNESEPRAFSLNVRAFFGNGCDGFTAKGAAKVPQENQEHGALRQKMGDGGREPRRIRTVRGIGYLLVRRSGP